MEELGDWVYIILMVVVGISSLFSSVKKKKKAQQMEMPTPVPSAPSEAWYPATPSVPNKKEKILPPPVPGQSKRQPLNAHLAYSDLDTGTQSEILCTQEDEIALVNKLELSDPDTFRKAVIYAEILNRKYLN